MGVVLLLVALPAVAVMALSLAVFDGVSAAIIVTLILVVIGSLLRAAREWDAERRAA
jgi:hypothetical protein